MPLTDKHILVTRAIHQSQPFCDLLRQQGAIPIRYPCIAIAPPDNTKPLDDALQNLPEHDWIIVTSTNTVFALQQRLEIRHQSVDWTKVKIAAVGHKTQASVQHLLNRQVAFVPSVYTADDLARQLPNVDGKRILIPQSAIANNNMEHILQTRGADVTTVTAYQTTIGQGGEDVPTLLQQNRIDILTFTSPSTAENFLKRIHPQTVPDLPTVCIGSSTAKIAKMLGYSQLLVPDDYTLEGMIEVMIGFYRG